MKHHQSTALVGMFAVGLGWATLSPSFVLAQSTALEVNPIQFTPPPLPDRGRPSGRQRGGASRGSCGLADGQSSLTALAPATQVSLSTAESAADESELLNYESVFSLTTEAHPSFWFYVPYRLDADTALEFVFQDESGETLYQTRFVAEQDSPSIVQVSLPESYPPLAVDAPYQWYFMVHCDLAAASEPPYVKGWIARTDINPGLQAQLAATTVESASLYAAHGIWQDALTVLGERYREDPQNVAISNGWASLLESVGLGELSAEPMADCCVASELAAE
ncbi:DUF928 domain-containing protein [Romeria aff. gracilis LEGE 07310]|uniref:DUF928 domain-containing protein n=1 Tax=Vasconcelosia minhoensis LEGE 07310 TaxID=915328 RepID=A0A8J7ANV2_9CYAN|nr:DUF928 domain-containing protein [Romeria gracilis]MBE9077566.1 DUF928 domain-containing protein [Romeria aff. gracilis LEGE 07310]